MAGGWWVLVGHPGIAEAPGADDAYDADEGAEQLVTSMHFTRLPNRKAAELTGHGLQHLCSFLFQDPRPAPDAFMGYAALAAGQMTGCVYDDAAIL